MSSSNKRNDIKVSDSDVWVTTSVRVDSVFEESMYLYSRHPEQEIVKRTEPVNGDRVMSSKRDPGKSEVQSSATIQENQYCP